MKNLLTLVCVSFCLCITTKTFAQDDALTTGSNFYPFLLDEDSRTAIGDKIVFDLAPNEETMYLYYWMANWPGGPQVPNGDGTMRYAFTCLANDDYEDFGYYDNDEYVNVEHDPDGVVNTLYAGFAFQFKNMSIDLSALDQNAGDYYFHVALKTVQYNSMGFTFHGYGGSEANYEIGDGSITDRPAPDVPLIKDGKWHLYEFPVQTLINKGIALHRPIVAADDLITLLAIFNYGPKYSTIGVDAMFFYNKTGTGINSPAVDKLQIITTKNTISVLNAVEAIEIYSITGQKVYMGKEAVIGTDELGKGVYVVKSGNATAKVVIR
jgi:hypothetical protein